MNRLRELIDNNKPVAILSVLTLILIIIGLICFSSKEINKNEEKKVLEEHSYTMYIKEEAIIKLVLRESFYKCGNTVCSDYTDKISSVELLNDIAKNIYSDANIKNKDLDEAISILLTEAKNKGQNITSLQIISNWKSRYNEDEFKELLKQNMGEIPTYPIIFEYREEATDESILASFEKKTYTVIFDSNLGTEVPQQTIGENELIVEPTPPTREGYDFVRWQYNNRPYNFSTPVTQDLTLRASWKKKPTVSTIKTTKKTSIAPSTPPQENTDQGENSGSTDNSTQNPSETPDTSPEDTTPKPEETENNTN